MSKPKRPVSKPKHRSDLAKRAPSALARRTSQRAIEVVEGGPSSLQRQAAVEVIGLLVAGGKLFLHAQQLRVESEASRKETQRTIALLDAETRNALQRMEAEMAPARSDTERLDKVLAHHRELRRMGEPADSVMCCALADFVRNLASSA